MGQNATWGSGVQVKSTQFPSHADVADGWSWSRVPTLSLSPLTQSVGDLQAKLA